MLSMWGTQSPISSLTNAWHIKVTRGTKRSTGASDNAVQTVSAAKTTNPVSRCEGSTSATGIENGGSRALLYFILYVPV
jgi:hypothetical protein